MSEDTRREIGEMRREMGEMRREVGEMRELLASQPPRAEIVTVGVYASDKRGIEERLRRLESNPQRQVGYWGLAVSIIGVLITGAIGVASVLLTLGTAMAGLVYFVLTHKP